MKPIVTQERLKEVLSYDPDTGLFRWKKSLSNRGPVGAIAGRVTQRGCIVIGIDTRPYKAHRLAFLYINGDWPVNKVDHRDGDPTNNAWENLRDVTQKVNSENARKPRSNNKSGLMGVRTGKNKFYAHITCSGVNNYLGGYDTAQEAHEAYLAAKRKLHEGNTL